MKTQGTLSDYTPDRMLPRWLFQEKGQLIEVGGNQPLLLDDANSVWIILSGRVDVFSTRLKDGRVAGARRRLFRADTGQALFGIHLAGQGAETGLLAGSAPGTSLLKLPRARLIQLTKDPVRRPDVVVFVNDWLNEVSTGIGQQTLPKTYYALEANQETVVAENRIVFPPKDVLWVKHRAGRSRFLDSPHPVSEQDGFIPISRYTPLQPLTRCTMYAVDTQTFITLDPNWSALDHFHQLTLKYLDAASKAQDRAENARLQAKAQADRAVVQNAMAGLAAILERRPGATPVPETKDDPLLAACRLVGETMGIAIHAPSGAHSQVRRNSPTRDIRLIHIARASHIRTRQVILRRDWQRRDNGPLLAYRIVGQKQCPVALLPISSTRYALHDPADGTQVTVTAQVAETLAPFAYTFYRPLPTRALSAWDLWVFGTRDTRRDWLTAISLAAIGGLLGLLVPLAIGWVFNDALAISAQYLLDQIFLALLVSAVAGAAFQFAQRIATLRLETRIAASIQAAIWDRLLSLPAPFFRQYTSGDIGSRAMGIERIQQVLGGTVIPTALSSVFALVNLGLMFHYDPKLAWPAALLVLAALAINVLFGYWQMRPHRDSTQLHGQISGIVLQFISGIAKLRVAGAERRAFAYWANRFGKQKKLDYKARSIANGLAVFNAAWPLFNLIVILALTAISAAQTQPSSPHALSAGNFVAFYAAFGQFLSAGLQFGAMILTILEALPIYERIRPILQTVPETDAAQTDPGELIGEIEVEHVSFRYKADGPLVLRDISLRFEPGEFVALVGPSGSGKSTLFRLLLGFETPDSGSIFYDGQALSELDIHAVRRQIGVVFQNGKLLSGDILHNIIGASNLTIQDAWQAARTVGLAQDIERMPMGMYTLIGHGGSTLSGGQRQRLLIARAIVHRPRILFFDEATSALDNTTQSTVSRSLVRLQATRVVIAHRLSTIIKADRILVIDHGQIIQSGDFDQLVEQQGLFAELAARQLM